MGLNLFLTSFMYDNKGLDLRYGLVYRPPYRSAYLKIIFLVSQTYM